MGTREAAGPSGEPRPYFENLDCLRWLSALAVIVTHVEMIRGQHGMDNAWSNWIVQNLGPVGVYFFFTLSGFLITHILVRYREAPLAETLPSFYVRRAGRILPLYYLLVVLGFFVLPQLSVFTSPTAGGTSPPPSLDTFLSFLFAQPHVASAFQQRVANISHLWSIGVEITFYCFWPLLVLRARHLVRAIFIFIVVIIGIKAALLLAGSRIPNAQGWFHLAATLKFECMAIGSLFALITPGKLWDCLTHRGTALTAMMLVPPVFLLYRTPLDNLVHLPLSVLFGTIIWNSARCPSSPIGVLANPVFNYLGRISYGIYCFHVAVINLLLNVAGPYFAEHRLLLYGATIVAVALVSSVSFHFFEEPIIRVAKRTAARC